MIAAAWILAVVLILIFLRGGKPPEFIRPCEICHHYKGDTLGDGTWYPMPAEGTYTVINCGKHPNGQGVVSGDGCTDWAQR